MDSAGGDGSEPASALSHIREHTADPTLPENPAHTFAKPINLLHTFAGQ